MYLLFDIGGTKMRIAVSYDGRRLGKVVVVATPRSAKKGLKIIKEIATLFAKGKKIDSVAGGIAGVLDEQKNRLGEGKNIPGWVGFPLAPALRDFFRAPIYLENDAALSGLGEATSGAGKGKNIVAYLTISTGVGGARIVDGKIDRKTFGFEPGKQIIDKGRTLEWFISGGELKKRFGEKIFKTHDNKIQARLGKSLAAGLNNTIVYWSPEIIVLGGSMMKMMSLAIVRAEFKKALRLKLLRHPPRIVRAKLGDFSGLYGALAYLRQKRVA